MRRRHPHPANRAWDDAYDAILNGFAALNALQVSRSGFTLRSLVDGVAHRLNTWSAHNDREAGGHWPGADHLSYFKRDRAPVAIITEPYLPRSDFGKLEELVDRLGLIIQSPPNPKASFHFPGATSLFMITKPDFGLVTWLPPQLHWDA